MSRTPDKSDQTRVLALLWHSAYDVITAGGFKRTYEIFKRTPDHVRILAIDNSPTFLTDLANRNVHVTEYSFPRIFPWIESRHFLLERLLEWLLAPFYMIFISARLWLRGDRFDVVLVPSSEIIPALLGGVAAKMLFRAPLVLCNYNIELFTPVTMRAVASLHNCADIVITLSDDLMGKLRANGVKAPIVVNGVGIDTDYIASVLGNHDFDKEYDAVFVGRHIKAKGVFDLVEAWHLVNEENPAARLVTIGSCDPGHMAVIETLLDKYDLHGNLIMVGTVDEATKFKLVKRSKVCLFPSYVEGWGIVPQEGLACGLPVVIYDLPVYQENAKPCEAVFTVDVGDYRGMAERTIELLSREDLQEYEGIGPDFVRGWKWDEIACDEFRKIIDCVRK